MAISHLQLDLRRRVVQLGDTLQQRLIYLSISIYMWIYLSIYGSLSLSLSLSLSHLQLDFRRFVV